MKWLIRYGLSGGFGGCGDWEEIEANNREEAESYAYKKLVELMNPMKDYMGFVLLVIL